MRETRRNSHGELVGERDDPRSYDERQLSPSRYPPASTRQWVNTAYVADRLGLSVDRVSQLCKVGAIPHEEVFGASGARAHYVFDRVVIERLREQRYRESKAS